MGMREKKRTQQYRAISLIETEHLKAIILPAGGTIKPCMWA